MNTYTGGCHCNTITYTLTTDSEITEAIECNCSFCESKGALFVFVPKEQFVLGEAGDNLTEYQFNKKEIRHFFCKTCGVATHGEGVSHPSAAINVRTLKGMDVQGIKRNPYNGKEA